MNLSNTKANGGNTFDEAAPTLDQASGRLAVSVQPESATKQARDSLTAKETDEAEALTRSFQKRSERGTLIVGEVEEQLDAPVDPKPDGPRYAAMGDAVTANVAEWIGLRLVAALERERAAA